MNFNNRRSIFFLISWQKLWSYNYENPRIIPLFLDNFEVLLFVPKLYIRIYRQKVFICNNKFDYNFFFLQTTSEYIMFAAVSKFIAALATYPYQVIRARLQDHHLHYNGTLDCLVSTWRYEGCKGFYKGLTPYLLHVLPNICLVLVIYEKFTNNS